MKDDYEIIIDGDKEKEPKSNEEHINKYINENSNESEGYISKKLEEKNQIENGEYINSDNINETENIDTNNNVNDFHTNVISQLSSSDRKEYNLDKNKVSQKESTTTINNTNINDNISTIPTKEEQNQEINMQIQNTNISQKNIPQVNSVIDESEEYKSIDKIFNFHDKEKENIVIQRNISSNIFNNKVYFTETNIPSLKLKNTLQKSNSTKLYSISTIPEYPYGIPKNIRKASPNQNTSAEKRKKIINSINEKLNNLSPDDYMRKKFVYKYNFKPLQYRIEKIKDEIEKQNKYDYERLMKELQLKYEKEKKNKEKEKSILEFHKQIEEKLKNMEEKRTNLYNQRLEKMLKKQIPKNIVKSKKNLNKSCESNLPYNIQNNTMEKNINFNTIDSYGYNKYSYENNEKLPNIQGVPRYELIKIMKEKLEEEFCNEVFKKLKDKEITHRKNYLKKLYDINDKIVKQNKLYRQRSMHCLFVKKNKDHGIEEEFLEKDMLKRYNIMQILIRERSAKKERINYNYLKKMENIRERKELLDKKDEEKIKEILKRLNKSINKQNFIRYNNRDYFANLQKKRYIQNNKDMHEYYNELIYRQGENLSIINELQKAEPDTKKIIIKRSLEEQDKKFKKLRSLDKFLEKMDKININNQNERTKRKIFKEKMKIENEKKMKEEDKLK